MSLDQGTRSVRGAGDGAHRTLCHMPRALDQARAQARVAQGRAAELVGRPGRGIESLARRQRRGRRRREALAPDRVEFVQIHRLGCLAGGMGTVLASAPAGLADPHPVRRAKARPRVLALVDERLQQPGPVTVQVLKVLAHPPHHPAQHMRGQVAAGDAGPNQKPAQPHHAMQPRAAARIVPADPGVASPQPPRRGREPHRPQPAVRRADQIAQLMADERARTTRVLVRHQGIPNQALFVAVDPNQRQLTQLTHLARDLPGRRHAVRKPARPSPRTAHPSRRR